MIFVTQMTEVVRVRMASQKRSREAVMYTDGGRDFAPEEELFGRHAAAVADALQAAGRTHHAWAEC
jgi:hypothetical protein